MQKDDEMTCECECHRREQFLCRRSVSHRFFRTFLRTSKRLFTISKTVPEKKIESEKSVVISPADEYRLSDAIISSVSLRMRKMTEEQKKLAQELAGTVMKMVYSDCNFPKDKFIKMDYLLEYLAAILQNLHNEEIERLNFRTQT